MSRLMVDTVLIGIRKPTEIEQKGGAEVVFIRQDCRKDLIYNISACVLYESWEQWGQSTDILCDNVVDVEAWRQEQEGDY